MTCNLEVALHRQPDSNREAMSTAAQAMCTAHIALIVLGVRRNEDAATRLLKAAASQEDDAICQRITQFAEALLPADWQQRIEPASS